MTVLSAAAAGFLQPLAVAGRPGPLRHGASAPGGGAGRDHRARAGSLRRLARHDPAARGWQQIRRLLRPLDDTATMLEGPLTSHRRRAGLDAAAVALLRCAETGRSYWAWTDEEWAGLLGQDQHGFRKAAPGWADDAVRPYLAAHAFLLGGLTAFANWAASAALPWPGASSGAPAWTAGSAGSARCWPDGATGSAVTTTSCCRWSPPRCSSSTAALTWRR